MAYTWTTGDFVEMGLADDTHSSGAAANDAGWREEAIPDQ